MTRSNLAKRILVVTNNRVTRESTRSILAEEGYVVDAAPTCASALERVRRRHPAAILIDLSETFERCCSFVATCRREYGATTPILVMAPTPRAALGAIRVGAQGYVKTPPERATIVPMLSQVHV